MTCLLMQSRMKFQPTRPLRGATFYGRRRFLIYHISTHAPLAGRDLSRTEQENQHRISTHAPLAGRDKYLWYLSRTEQEFQPTRPLRGATNRVLNPCNSSNISTHAPLAGRDECSTPISSIRMRISTHAPLAGRDEEAAERLKSQEKISTHAPLAGRDRQLLFLSMDRNNFNPRAPCGARRYKAKQTRPKTNFNPRAPCGARHGGVVQWSHVTLYFNPRAPCGARLLSFFFLLAASGFQPTRPLRGATAKVYKSLCTFLR